MVKQRGFVLFSNIIQNLNIAKMKQPQSIVQSTSPFLVSVKLLSGQVHQFEVDKCMKVSDFKTIIQQKLHISPSKMRLLFAGKQLLDHQTISQCIPESGLTIHLVVREQNQPQQPIQPSMNFSPIQNTSPTNFLVRSTLSIFGSETSELPSSNNAFDNLLNRLRSSQQNTSNLTNFRAEIPSEEGSLGTIEYSGIMNLNNSLNSLNLPSENYPESEQINERNVAKYLKKLQIQNARALASLNGCIQMLQSGNSSSVKEFVPVLQSLNEANKTAIDLIKGLRCQNQGIDTVCMDRSDEIRTQIVITHNLYGNSETQRIVRENYSEQAQQTMMPAQQINMEQFADIQVQGNMMKMELGEFVREVSNAETPMFVKLFNKMTIEDGFKAISQKNFEFFNKKYPFLKKQLLKELETTEKLQLAKQLANNLSVILVPCNDNRITNEEVCKKEDHEIMEKIILQWIDLTLKEQQQDYAEKMVFLMKKMFCKIMENNIKHIENNDEEHTFKILKRQTIIHLNYITQGMFEMFYTLVERDLKRIFDQYKEQNKQTKEKSTSIKQEEKIEEKEESLNEMNENVEEKGDYQMKVEKPSEKDEVD